MKGEPLVKSDLELALHEGLTKNLQTIKESIKEMIYTTFGEIYNCWKEKHMKFSTQLISEILLNCVVTLQLISMNGNSNFHIFESTKLHWQIMSYASFDRMCADSNLLYQCYLGSNILVALCFFSIFSIAFLSYRKKIIPSYLLFISKQLLDFVSSVGFIPISIMFILTAKYSIIGSNNIQEYEKCSNCNLNLGIFGYSVSSIGTLSLYAVTWIRVLYSSDLRHSAKSENLNAKAHSLVDKDMTLMSLASVTVYTVANEGNYFWYQLILLMWAARVVYMGFKYAPKYNLAANEIIIVRNTAIFCSTLIFAFGRALDDEIIILLLFGIFMPLIIILVISQFRKKFKTLGKNIINPTSQFDFEHKLRPFLTENSSKNVIDEFSNINNSSFFNKNKLLVIWETNYCINILKDERLARIKIHKCNYLPSTLEGDYQEWLIYKGLERNNIGVYDDISLMFYILDLKKIKCQDELLCHGLVAFGDEINSSKPRLHKINTLMKNVSISLEIVKKKYSELVMQFPYSINCHELYGSLLFDVLFDTDLGSKMLSKKESLIALQNQRNQDKFAMISETNGFMLISASGDSFGIITHANSKASQIFNQPAETIIGSKVNNYVPFPFDTDHDYWMRRFVANCTNPEPNMPVGPFFQSERGCLIECQFKQRLVSLMDRLYFLVSFKENNKNREIAFVSDEGIIYAHSEKFPHFLDKPQISIKGQCISHILPRIIISEMEPCKPYLISNFERELLFIHNVHNILSNSMHMLFLIHDKEEILEGRKSKGNYQHNYGSQDNNDDYKSSSILESNKGAFSIDNKIFSYLDQEDALSKFEISIEEPKNENIKAEKSSQNPSSSSFSSSSKL